MTRRPRRGTLGTASDRPGRSDSEDTLVRHLITTSIAIGAIALFAGACGGSNPAASPTAAAAATTSAPIATKPPNHDVVKLVEVNGHKLDVACVGPIDSGRPTVIFETGLGGDLE